MVWCYRRIHRDVDLCKHRVVAVAATFLAAADGGVVTMAHLIRALRREYQKMGKVTLPGDYAGFAAG